MQALRQLGGGVFIALVSIILVVGGISLALAESASPLETQTQVIPTLQLSFSTSALSSVSTQPVIPTATATPFPSAASIPPTQIVCTPPSGWFQIVVAVNDTIYTLSQRYKTSEDTLKTANCLPSYEIQAGTFLYVPPIVATAPPVVCSPPSTWVRAYVVQPGDNLFRISLLYRTTVPQLQSANCMGSSILIYTGQRLWVPNVPTSTPVPGVTIIPNFPTSTPSFTPVPPTFTLTAWPTATATQTIVPTSSPAPTATQTTAPTATVIYTPSITPFP